MTNKTNTEKYKKILQWGSVALILFSVIPCLLLVMNTPSVIERAKVEQVNYGLQIFLPLCSASAVNGLGLMLLIVSLVMKENSSDETERED